MITTASSTKEGGVAMRTLATNVIGQLTEICVLATREMRKLAEELPASYAKQKGFIRE
jgi:hypothetical protein